jgi:protein-S-isoprenylcysteine O-methyltransferase Ste14
MRTFAPGPAVNLTIIATAQRLLIQRWFPPKWPIVVLVATMVASGGLVLSLLPHMATRRPAQAVDIEGSLFLVMLVFVFLTQGLLVIIWRDIAFARRLSEAKRRLQRGETVHTSELEI